VKTLVTITGLSLTQIAKRAGFQDLQRLNTAFQRRTGCSPNQNRNQRGGLNPMISPH
jgi:AraC-like DNA-binding protein